MKIRPQLMYVRICDCGAETIGEGTNICKGCGKNIEVSPSQSLSLWNKMNEAIFDKGVSRFFSYDLTFNYDSL